MGKDNLFGQLIESLSNEKGLPREIVVQALSEALAAVTAKQFVGETPLVEVDMDSQSGEYVCYRVWHIVADEYEVVEEEEKDRVIKLSAAIDLSPDANLTEGDAIRQEVPSEGGRIAAHAAGQVLNRLVKEAERAKMADIYRQRIGGLIIAQVKRVTKDHIIVDVAENVEASLSREDMLPREIFRNGDRLRGYIVGLNEEGRGPLVRLSRICPEILGELFKIEVPEISEGSIEIRGIARDPGVRSKVSVKAIDTRIDPVGACVGIRGGRVQAVTSELNGERIDIILWEDDIAKLAVRSIAPAEVISVEIDEENHSIDVIVAEDQLSLAIGRNGQNVRLASQLLGRTINIMSEHDADVKQEEQVGSLRQNFADALDIDEEVADVLINEGFSSIESIAYINLSELINIEEFDEDIAQELQSRAKSSLLETAVQGAASGKEPQDDLLALAGMTPKYAYFLAEKGIVCRDDLADMSIDEVVEIIEMPSEEAGQLIMSARQHWFDDEKI